MISILPGQDNRTDEPSRAANGPAQRSRLLLSIFGVGIIAAAGYLLVRAGLLPASFKTGKPTAEVPRLFPVRHGCIVTSTELRCDEGRWGFIDSHGTIVIPLQFDAVAVQGFSEGLCAVEIGGKWGYIDETGNYVVPPQFEDYVGRYSAGPFSQGLAGVYSGGKAGFIDKQGQFVINPQFNAVSSFREGLAAVAIGEHSWNEKWGFIDKHGRYGINPQFDSADNFAEGLAAVQLGNKWGYIDHQGRYVVNPQFDYAGEFSEGVATVKLGKNWGYIDKARKYVINPQFDGGDRFTSNGLAPVQIGDRLGYIRKDGTYAINPQFEDAESFSEGKAAVKMGGKWGYIDETGKIVIAPTFTTEGDDKHPGQFERGIASIDPYSYIDTQGHSIWPDERRWQALDRMVPILRGDMPDVGAGDQPLDGKLSTCDSDALCFQIRQGNLERYGAAIYRDPYYDGCILSARIRNKTSLNLNTVILHLSVFDGSGALIGNPSIVVYDIPPNGVAVKDMTGSLLTMPTAVKVAGVID